MTTIDLVMVTYLRDTFTRKSIKNIVERTRRPYRLTLVVNGAKEHDKKVINGYFDMYRKGIIDHLVLLRENYGIHAGKNAALPLVQSDYYIDMDNDILVPDLTPDWTSQLEYLITKYPGYGSISLRPQVLVGRSGKEFDGKDLVVDFSHTGAHGRIMKTSIVKAVRGWAKTWDAKRNSEDKYIAARLKDKHLKSGYAKDLRCFHLFGDDEMDPWGYPKDQKPEDHGHREIWPPVNVYGKMDKYDKKTWQPLKEGK